MRRIIGAAAIIVGVITLTAGVAAAHDVTPDSGSQCTSPTTGEIKFNATNMGSEVRDIFVYLNGNLVGSLLDFTGNGSHKVDITVPAGLTGDVTFTWSTDAVSHPPANIVVNWDKPKCQPEVTTTTTATTLATTTTEGTTTTLATTTTVGQTTTTAATTTVGTCAPLCAGQFGTTTTVPETTTTAAQTTTVAPTTIPETTAVDQTVPAPVVTPEPELPHTGSETLPAILVGLALSGAGVGLVAAGKRRG